MALALLAGSPPVPLRGAGVASTSKPTCLPPGLQPRAALGGRARRAAPQSPFRSNRAAAVKPTALGAYSEPQGSGAQQVLDWAREAYEYEVLPDVPNHQINMAKACLLISLEEESAKQVYKDTFANVDSRIRNELLKKQAHTILPSSHSLDEEEEGASNGLLQSTWSGNRLDALAAEVKSEFMQTLGMPEEEVAENPSDLEISKLMREYPLRAVEATKAVLFDRHGYTRMEHYGDPHDAIFSNCMERGFGTPATLSILFCEVAGRAGLRMRAISASGSTYFVLTPVNAPLRLGDTTLVVDPYQSGSMYTAEEFASWFDCEHEEEPDLPEASHRELLAAMLDGLVISYWCQALGCRPEPAYMVPLEVGTVFEYLDDLEVVSWFALDRAVAAAERRLLLAPQEGEFRLELALLLYFSGRLDDSLEALEEYLEEPYEEDLDLVKLLYHRILLMRAEDAAEWATEGSSECGDECNSELLPWAGEIQQIELDPPPQKPPRHMDP